MMKKILPAMIGVALVGGMTAASADVSVMGHIDTSIDRIDTGSADDINMNCTTCSIGFKGSEDLGNGLKAIFSIDFEYDTTERNKNITDRDQWLGLSGGFGKVRAGTISTVYKSHGAMLDPLYRTSLQGRTHGLQTSAFHSGAGEETQGRATNTIRWDSVDFNGIKVGATYTIDNTEADGEDNNPFGIGASYENGGILVFADYITNNGDAATAAGDISAWKVGGKYEMNDFAVMAQYEDSTEDNSNTDMTQWMLSGSYTMGSNMLYAGYGNNQVDTASVTTADVDSWTIAGVHSFSKATSAYVGYNSMDDSKLPSNSKTDQLSVGMKHKF